MPKQPLPDARPRSRPSTFAAEDPVETVVPGVVEPTAVSTGVDVDTPASEFVYPYTARASYGENPADVKMAESYFVGEIAPDPGVETMLVYCLVDHTRELDQLEKAKRVLIRMGLSDFLVEMMEPSLTKADQLVAGWSLKSLAKQWALGVPGAEAEVARRLGVVGMATQDILTNGYAMSLGALDRLSALMERTERRRDRVIRTIEHRRAIRSLVEVRAVQLRRADDAWSGAVTSSAPHASLSDGRADV